MIGFSRLIENSLVRKSANANEQNSLYFAYSKRYCCAGSEKLLSYGWEIEGTLNIQTFHISKTRCANTLWHRYLKNMENNLKKIWTLWIISSTIFIKSFQSGKLASNSWEREIYILSFFITNLNTSTASFCIVTSRIAAVILSLFQVDAFSKEIITNILHKNNFVQFRLIYQPIQFCCRCTITWKQTVRQRCTVYRTV